MKKIITLLFILTFGLGLNTLQAAFVVVLPADKDAAKSKKEIRKANKQEKKTKKVEQMIEKVQKKAAHKKGKKKGAMADDGLNELDRNLRLAIIFGIVAIAATILVAIIGSIWWLPSIFWLIALIFLILWLVQDA